MHHLQPAEARAFMDARDVTEYTLLDVRQPWEFEELRLPGARNLPLPELADRAAELDRDRPVLVYCRTGGRSQAAAGLLDGQGFGQVYNILGGVSSWNGAAAQGPLDLGMQACTGHELPEDLALLAFGMEMRLQAFYRDRAAEADPETRAVFERLAGFEDRHKNALLKLYNRLASEPATRIDLERRAAEREGTPLVEGGLDPEAFRARVAEMGDMVATPRGAVELAMALEAQAHDYYARCADRVESEANRAVVRALAQEEKTHLRMLGRFLDARSE